MKIKNVVVIGSGTMGSGIAAHLCNANIPVTLLDLKTEISEKARERIHKSRPPLLIDKSKINNIKVGNISDNFDVVKDADWIVEAVVERIDVKHQIYEKIFKVRKDGAIVSSNTSSIPIKVLSEHLSDVEKKDFQNYLCLIPLNLSDLLLKSSTVVSSAIDKATRQVAIHNITGLISCLKPAHICLGIVTCSTLPTNKTTTTSSNEVINANKAPEITPGKINGIITLKKGRIVSPPKLCEAPIKLLSKPVRVAVTVITTKGVPSAVCASIKPVYV